MFPAANINCLSTTWLNTLRVGEFPAHKRLQYTLLSILRDDPFDIPSRPIIGFIGGAGNPACIEGAFL